MNNDAIYSVSLYSTPMSFPLNFTRYTWVEICDSVTTHRYDFWAYPGLKTTTKNKGYIYENIFPNHLGTTFWPLANTKTLTNRQTGKCIQTLSGPRGSVAHSLYQNIKANAFQYPLYSTYKMLKGPNCNTYTQWLLDTTPEAKMPLPWNAWGKSYRVYTLPNVNTLLHSSHNE